MLLLYNVLIQTQNKSARLSPTYDLLVYDRIFHFVLSALFIVAFCKSTRQSLCVRPYMSVLPSRFLHDNSK